MTPARHPDGEPLARRAGSALTWRVVQLGAGKVIYLARILILARLLTPDDFGLLAISVTALSLLWSLTDTGMVPALIQRRATDRAHYDVAWTVGLVRAVLVAAAVGLAAPAIGALFAEPRAVALMRVLALRALLDASMSIRVADLHRDLRFRGLAALHLTEAIVNTVVAIALVSPLGVWALIAGPLAGSAAQTFVSYLIAPYRPRLIVDRGALAPLFGFGRWIFVSGIIAVAGSSLVQLVVARELGAAELGLYFLAAKLGFLLASVSSEVVGAVAFPLYARLQDDSQQTSRAFRSSLSGLAAVVAPASFLLIALAPSLVQNVLSASWQGTVPLIRLLALCGVVGLVGDIVVPVLKGVGRPAKVVAMELVQYGLLVSLAWVLARALGVTGAALAWLPAVAASQLVGIALVRRAVPQPFRGALLPLAAILAAAGAAGTIAWAVDAALPGLAGLVAGAGAGAVAAVAGLWTVDGRLGLTFVQDFRRVFPRRTTRATSQ